MRLNLSVTKKQKRFIDAKESEVLFGGAAELSGNAAGIVLAVGAIALKWFFLLWLFRRKIFFKI